MRSFNLNEECEVIIFGKHFSLSNNIYHIDEVDDALKEHFGKSVKSKSDKFKKEIALNLERNPNEEISYNDLYLFLDNDFKSIVARTTQNIYLIEELSKDNKIVYDLIRNPNIPLFVLKDLAKRKDVRILQELVCFTPQHTLKDAGCFELNQSEILKIAFKTILSLEDKVQTYLLSDLVQNENASEDLLTDIYFTSKDDFVKRVCLQNKNFSSSKLSYIFNLEASKKDTDFLIFSILQNPNTSETLLIECLNNPKFSKALKHQALSHKNMPVSVLENEFKEHKNKANDDRDSFTKLCEIVRNPSTPDYILEELSTLNSNDINYWLLLNSKVLKSVLTNIINYSSEENTDEDEDDFDRQENLRNAKRLLKSLNTSTQK